MARPVESRALSITPMVRVLLSPRKPDLDARISSCRGGALYLERSGSPLSEKEAKRTQQNCHEQSSGRTEMLAMAAPALLLKE